MAIPHGFFNESYGKDVAGLKAWTGFLKIGLHHCFGYSQGVVNGFFTISDHD
jgi:hypothetical protein